MLLLPVLTTVPCFGYRHAPSSGPPDGLDVSSTEPEEQFNILLAQVLVSPWNEANATW